MNNDLIKNIYPSKYACQASDAIFFNDEDGDFRPPFFHDADRIIYSRGFSRYLNKTQVFTYQQKDYITRRINHVIYVSKIARTIGRALGLNEDLIEAAALGHDLGHTPFGHVGESFLNELSLKHNEGFFNHNIESVRLLKDIENYGNGLNISIQVLDAIMCHNGEILEGKYEPKPKTKEQFLEEYEKSYHDKNALIKMQPMTLEGCVVRISDLIAYLGRDIEDGIRLNLIKEEDIPLKVKNVLGTKNREIISRIINDIIINSKDKNYILLSKDIYEAINALKNFNYQNIYAFAYTDEERKEIKEIFATLFDEYLLDLKEMKKTSSIVKYYKKMNESYQKNTYERIVIDYISGMTDDYCLKEYNKIKKIKHNRKEVEHDL